MNTILFQRKKKKSLKFHQAIIEKIMLKRLNCVGHDGRKIPITITSQKYKTRW